MTFVGSIRAVVTRRVLISGALLALLAAACSSPTPPGASFGEGQRFLTAVADSQDTVGLAPSVAVAEDGTQYIAYLGFPDEIEDGEIAVPRPIGAPFLPAVMLTSVNAEGMFTRGAVAQNQPEEEPIGIEPPFRPAKVPDLDLTQENANGTGIAIAASGAVHVVWTSGNTVSHAVTSPAAEGASAGDTVMTTVFELDLPVSQAGPIGKPSVTLDSAGAPIVAFGVIDGSRIAIDVATLRGEEWTVETVATTDRCDGCPPPLPAAIVNPEGGTVVAYGNTQDGAVHAAVSDGETWTDELVESGADGTGMAATTDGSSTFLTYYSGAGEVRLAERSSDGVWSTGSAAETNDPDEVTGVEAATTGIAVHEDTIYVTWQDEEGIQLVESDGESFTDVPSTGTSGGISPSVAVSAEGMVTLAWYSPTTQDLRVGFWGELGSEIMVANPSPAPTQSITVAPSPCGGKVADLQIAALPDNTFDKDCLVAPAEEDFEIAFDNQGGQHNIHVFESQGGGSIALTEPALGPYTEQLPVDPQEVGEYYFQCDIHPTTMFGTLAAVQGAK